MNTPRIGDTVHYVPQTQRYAGRCLAAMIIDNTDPDEITVMAWTPDGAAFAASPTYDTRGAMIDDDGDTPGTWHHLH